MKESNILEKLLRVGRKVIPKSLFRAAQPLYHYLLAVAGAAIYRFPAKQLTVIGVTGTKGKSTTVELVNAILEEAGKKTALASTVRYKIGEKEWRNMFKMTLRGRFFTQSFLRQAVDSGCTHAVIELSSEGVPQSRHKFLFPDALIFTNLAPEHIESHGSYENYVRAKLSIAKELERPASQGQSIRKHSPVLVVNKDDKESGRFLELNIKDKLSYSLSDAVHVRADEKGSSFQVGKMVIHSKLPGLFNIYNMLGAIAYAKFLGIPEDSIKSGLEKLSGIRGRMEKVEMGQSFEVVVDYAHTPDSLTAVYETYSPRLAKKSASKEKFFLIGVLGNTGGGRDTWKRAEMGKIADKYCSEIILTNEDPYDEDPLKILEEMKKGIKKKPCRIILDRREAIREALASAKASADKRSADEKSSVAVLITGKGTDPYIMGPNGSKIPWDDASVAREELQKILDASH